MKKIVSLFLTIILVLSVFLSQGLTKTHAAGETLDVTLELSKTGSSWEFSHSDLPAEYQGTSDPWKTVRYRFAAYKDDSVATENIWIELLYFSCVIKMYNTILFANITLFENNFIDLPGIIDYLWKELC